jgi:hypothetical protein
MSNNQPNRGRTEVSAERRHTRAMVCLLIAIPGISVLLGIVTLILAFGGPDQEIHTELVPLSKTSWEQGRYDDR